MVAIMIGSGLFGAMIARVAPEVIAVGNFIIAAVSLASVVVFVESPKIVLAAFLLFEVRKVAVVILSTQSRLFRFVVVCIFLVKVHCVANTFRKAVSWVYHNIISSLHIVAERSAIMNFFRIPLNLLVVLVLVKVGSLENHTVFMIIVSWLALAALLQLSIVRRRDETSKVDVDDQ